MVEVVFPLANFETSVYLSLAQHARELPRDIDVFA
jgi:hypothetical protein